MSRLSLSRHQRALNLLLIVCACAALIHPAVTAQPAPSRSQTNQTATRLSALDDAFLEDLSRRAFLYFQEHADPQTGLVLDRARTDGAAHGASHPSHNIASSAATGFGLTALCIAAERVLTC